MRNGKFVQGLMKLILAAFTVATTGCVSVRRTGQLFLTTRENYAYVTYRPCREGMFDPVRFFAFPFVAVGTVTFAPAYDILCLPVDLLLKVFGTRVEVVGEDGIPISGAEVSFCGDEIGESWFSSGRHNTGVFFPALERGSVSVKKIGYYGSTVSVEEAMCGADSWCVPVTVRLQRVEHPIPLFVKRVELRDYERGIGGFDGTNSVLRFDLMKGDWLPPYGKGEVADMAIGSRIKITGTGKFRKPYPEFGWTKMDFYMMKNECSLQGADGIAEVMSDPKAGIKIRDASKEIIGCSVLRVSGVRQMFERNGKDWYTQNFNDQSPDRCYTFRIRTLRNDRGELVEAYYGKIYGDFEFEGDDKKGLIGVKFLYYLNPKSLDRNLEWDMKTNLCPTAGKHESQQP